MKKFDYLTKEELNTFFYSTITEDRLSSKFECINGRLYEKYGTLQAITFVGKLYRVKNTETGIYENVLHIGMSKQHPNDTHINKKIAMEVAVENTLINPFAIIALEDQKIDNYRFTNIVKEYYNNMNVKFIRTREEIKNLSN